MEMAAFSGRMRRPFSFLKILLSSRTDRWGNASADAMRPIQGALKLLHYVLKAEREREKWPLSFRKEGIIGGRRQRKIRSGVRRERSLSRYILGRSAEQPKMLRDHIWRRLRPSIVSILSAAVIWSSERRGGGGSWHRIKS